MTPDQILTFALFAFATSITPGPNNTMLLASGANFGFRPTVPHLLGVDLGFAAMIVAVGLGLGGLFAAFPVLHTVLRIAGSLYLLYLAFRIATCGGPGAGRRGAKPLSFLQAAGFQWLNPKGWISAVGAVATYTPAQGFLVNLLIVTATFALVMLPCITVWAAAGTALRGVLSRPSTLRVFNITMALLLVASLYPVLVGGARAAGIREIGHLYAGGEDVRLSGLAPRPRIRAPGLPPLDVDPNGDYIAGATYVGFVKLAHPRHRFPVLMIPGGGLSGAVYETTPDGRPGWQWAFLREGYSVFVADFDRTGRSSFARYPEIDPDEPSFRSNAFLWEVFRIGPHYGAPAYARTQFPVDAFANFVKQAQPRFRIAPDDEARAFDDAIRAVCPCILLTHSAPGAAGMAAASRWPGLVKAVVSIEPSGVPQDVPQAKFPPHLFLWGDFLDGDSSWAEEVAASKTYRDRLAAQGTRADWMALPKLGIRGNSHMLMCDRNSDKIAGLIARWLRSQRL